MSDYVIGSFVGGGFVLAGALLAAVRDRLARKAERKALRESELKTAMREYLAALDAIALELADQPPVPRPGRLDTLLDRAADRTGASVLLFIITRLIRRAAYGRRLDELSDRVVSASAHLRLIAPEPVETVMREVQETAERYQPGSARWVSEWKVIRERVRATFRDQLGEPDD